MPAKTVYDQISERLASQFSLTRYFGDDAVWDRVVDALIALPAESSYAMQLDGRLDVASQAIYKTPELDWVLAVYNGAKGVGSDMPLLETAESVVSLAAGESMQLSALIVKEELLVSYNGENKPVVDGPDGSKQADLDGDDVADVRFVWNESGSITVMNIGSFTWRIVMSYFTRYTDGTLMAGQRLAYPSISDVKSALADVIAKEEAQTFTGFARL